MRSILFVSLYLLVILPSCKTAKTNKITTRNNPTYLSKKVNNNPALVPVEKIPSNTIKSRRQLFESLNSEVNTPIRLGVGFNSITQEQTSEAIEFDGVSPSSGTAIGGGTIFISEIIKDYKSLVQKTRMTVDASLKLATFSGSFKGDLFRSFKFNSKSIFLFAECIVTTPSLEINGAKFSPEAKREAEVNINRFFQNNGDEFVFKQNRGGSLKIIFEFKSTNQVEEENNEIQAKAAKKFFSGGWKVQANIQNELNNILNNEKATLYFFREGDYSTVPKMDFDSLQSYARDFPSTVAPNTNKDLVYSVETKSYKYAGNKPRNIHLISSIVNKSQKYLEAIQEAMFPLYESLGNINYLKENKNDYNITQVNNLIGKELDITNQIRELKNLYDDYKSNLAFRFTPDQIRKKKYEYVAIPQSINNNLIRNFDISPNAVDNKIYLGNIITNQHLTGILKGRLAFHNQPQAENIFLFDKSIYYQELYRAAFPGTGTPTAPHAPDLEPIHIFLHHYDTNELIEDINGKTGKIELKPGKYKVYALVDSKGKMYNGSALFLERSYISILPNETVTLFFKD